MKALVIGSGAIGSFYGALLSKAGVRVSVLARSDYDDVKTHGIAIHSETKLAAGISRPSRSWRRLPT
jgi:2-dehydropantoate 2-reductase